MYVGALLYSCPHVLHLMTPGFKPEQIIANKPILSEHLCRSFSFTATKLVSL